MQKQKRHRDAKFIQAMRSLPCMACGSRENIEAHHIKTVGSGGDDRAENVIPLCVRHHKVPSTESWHFMGPSKFLQRHPHIWEYLKKLGWEWRGNHLRHPSFDKLDE